MSSITNSNINSAVVNVGRTTPVSPGAQPASKSIPVVMASDQTSIPVVEQNKIQSEVALSLLGIPRAEIALGIFADVNTYDVNPSEWSMKPAYHISGDGVAHLPTEAGALVEASRNKTAVLTSKRFFRYQPGRVSAATFGIKSSVSIADFAQNPVIRKYGIYDKYDGYYWETRNSGKEDNFAVVRRTQSLQYGPISPYGISQQTKLRGESNTASPTPDKLSNTQLDDYRIVGYGKSESEDYTGTLETDRKILTEKRFEIVDSVLAGVVAGHNAHCTALLSTQTTLTGIKKGWTSGTTSATILATNASYYADLATAFNQSVGYPGLLDAAKMEAKCKRDLDYWIDNFLLDLEFGGNAHTAWNTTNFALADSQVGNEWETPLHNVGVFPKISIFEAPLHKALLDYFTSIHTTDGLSTAAKDRLVALQTIVANSFGNSDDASTSNYSDTFVPANVNSTTVPSASGGVTFYAIDYGTKDKLETFFDVKRNFWSYFVTTKKAPVALQNGMTLSSDKKYTIKAVGTSMSNTWTSLSVSDPYVGRVFSGNNQTLAVTGASAEIYENIVYTQPNFGTSSADSATQLFQFRNLGAAGDDRIKQLIADKCQRDVGYIIDGYKNDILGGGNAETTYNASMFMRGTGLSVYSQKEDFNGNGTATLSEIKRHEYLKTLMSRELKAFDSADNGVQTNYESVHGGSGDGGSFNELSELIVANFNNENTNTLINGSKPFPGNLVVLRDGLIHTHAAIYDPSLLKDVEKIKAVASGGVQTTNVANQEGTVFKLTKGNVTFGQHVKIYWTGDATSITIVDNGATTEEIYNGEVLRVRRVIGPKGNEFTLQKANKVVNQDDNYEYQLVSLTQSDIDDTSGTGTFFFETVVPFIFPKDYDLDTINPGQGALANIVHVSEIDTTYATLTNDASDSGDQGDQRQFRTFGTEFNTQAVPVGAMFPYMYSVTDDLLDGNLGTGTVNTLPAGVGDYVGFINTSLDPNASDGGLNIDRIRSQIDNVNFYPEYVNWIKNNVKPEYWGVYEYRIPRSRFSHDSLDGIKSNATAKSAGSAGARKRVYSDIVTGLNASGTNTIVRPGQNFFETLGVAEFQNSEYDFDFTKVTMLKIEFSWYGAVGALFLAYIPVGNGEARWVRVHHLRASNQLKIASLGNATLPITYTTYGGGSAYCLGDGEDVPAVAVEQGYGSTSHHIVKYGASYYIDGGDRGTVRLYSHNNDSVIDALGKQFPTTSTVTTAQESFTGSGGSLYYITVDGSTYQDAEFFMGASIKTGNLSDTNIKVVWIDGSKLYLSSQIQGAAADIKIIPDRATTIYGIETKKTILSTREQNAVRNRVQVYPTKLSSANIGSNPVRLRFKKTPLFQTDVTPTGSLELNTEYTVDNTNTPLTVTAGSANFLANGQETYGWFRARISAEFLTVFGRLYKDTDQYYFELLESYEGTVVLVSGGSFLADKKFLASGVEASSSNTKFSYEKEGLSSVKIATNPVVPIPNTGINVATTYLRAGTEQFDLATYFDYNKEYLSFPLTDIADTLYFAVDSDTNIAASGDGISLGVTWEEQ